MKFVAREVINSLKCVLGQRGLEGFDPIKLVCRIKTAVRRFVLGYYAYRSSLRRPYMGGPKIVTSCTPHNFVKYWGALKMREWKMQEWKMRE